MNPSEKRNKDYRNFMKTIRSKFTLEQLSEYKFVEVRTDTTDMVIDGATVYKINISEKAKETYLLIVGDLQLKSSLIRQIDPAYKIDKVIKEQYDFLERIKAKENAKIIESQENIFHDEEFDELKNIESSDSDDEGTYISGIAKTSETNNPNTSISTSSCEMNT
jgi:NACalpha-BTF3-like transcription factor